MHYLSIRIHYDTGTAFFNDSKSTLNLIIAHDQATPLQMIDTGCRTDFNTHIPIYFVRKKPWQNKLKKDGEGRGALCRTK